MKQQDYVFNRKFGNSIWSSKLLLAQMTQAKAYYSIHQNETAAPIKNS
jgi:hypothetical protein